MFEQSTDAGSNELKVFIGGIPLDWDEGEVRRFMQQFGVVEKVRINRDDNNKPKGFGFATFSAHLNPALIYGKHPHHSHLIEIKLLLQRCLYLLLPSPDSLSSADIREYFQRIPYPVESIEPTYISGSPESFNVKVTFTRDHNLKDIIDKRFIIIAGVRVEVTDHLEKSTKPGKHNNPGKTSNGKHKKRNQTHANGARHDNSDFENLRDHAEDGIRPDNIRPFDGASSSAFKSIVEATEEGVFAGAGLDSDFSSRSKRKLSFGKGKAIEGFVPQHFEKPVPYQVSQSTPDFSQKHGAIPFSPMVQPNFPLPHMNVWPSNLMQSANYSNQLAGSLPAISLHGYASNSVWTADMTVTKKEPTINFFTFPGRD